MTEQKKYETVIKGLECCAEWGKCKSECPYDGKNNSMYECTTQLAKDTLKLLKAQEPVEPVFKACIETDLSYWECGACKAFIFGNAYPNALPESKPKYCSYCGKAVKWND